MSETHIGFYGDFPESWKLTPEQQEAFKAMERSLGVCVDLECQSDPDDDSERVC